jgi:hypothetical protein
MCVQERVIKMACQQGTKSARAAPFVCLFLFTLAVPANWFLFHLRLARARVANKLLPLRQFPDAFIVRPADLI